MPIMSGWDDKPSNTDDLEAISQLSARVRELTAALAAILALGHTADPAEDAKAMRGIARTALGGKPDVGATLKVVEAP